MPNPNMQNANMPNVKVPNPKMSTRHSAEGTLVPNYKVPKCQEVNVIKCRMYQHVALQWTEPTNCRIFELTPPYWAALISDVFALRDCT
jgi:hypothetical protein